MIGKHSQIVAVFFTRAKKLAEKDVIGTHERNINHKHGRIRNALSCRETTISANGSKTVGECSIRLVNGKFVSAWNPNHTGSTTQTIAIKGTLRSGLFLCGADSFAEREQDVEDIYQTEDTEIARNLLAKYDVDYVYVGPRERRKYYADGEDGLGKFSEIMKPVFNEGDVVLYRLVQ